MGEGTILVFIVLGIWIVFSICCILYEVLKPETEETSPEIDDIIMLHGRKCIIYKTMETPVLGKINEHENKEIIDLRREFRYNDLSPCIIRRMFINKYQKYITIHDGILQSNHPNGESIRIPITEPIVITEYECVGECFLDTNNSGIQEQILKVVKHIILYVMDKRNKIPIYIKGI